MRFDSYDAVVERLIRYAKIDTGSLHGGKETPTTHCQYDLARVLEEELKVIGAENVWLDEDHCIVYGTIPSTKPEGGGFSLGFIAHMDVSPDVPTKNAKPWVRKNYDGGDICLNEELGILMKAEDYPALAPYVGEDLVMTDGTTLLGGDDKAAIASLMTAAQILLAHPEIEHGPVQIAFTPDEEVGGLAKDLDLSRFGAEVAYTIDGDHAGTYSYETFNATEAIFRIHGRNVHPGTAKGVMINALDVAAQLMGMLPAFEKPQFTEGRQGYFHVHGICGTVEECEIRILIRDHDEELFNGRVAYIEQCAAALRAEIGEVRVDLSYGSGYRSMKKVIDRVPFMIDNLVRAICDCGMEPENLPFRGGTDGSALSQRGLPCPNISAGYENGHSRFEFVPVSNMEKNVDLLVRLCEIYAKQE